ncbi:site-2 protease family protein [Oceanobacillus sp. CAU 1775]
MAKIFKWRIRKIMLWIFGGVMETDDYGTRSMKEDVLVTIAGPAQHLTIYLIFVLLHEIGLMNETLYQTAITYNLVILLFNLLPIWPLDGGKLLFFLMTLKYPYRASYNVALLISMVLCSVLFIGHLLFFPFTLSFLCIILFIFFENQLEWKRRFYLFLRFLLKRYEGIQPVSRLETLYCSGDSKLIDVFSSFKRERKHTLIVTDKPDLADNIDEMDLLHAYFYKKQYRETLYEILR